MSIKLKIMDQLSRKPLTLGQLKDILGNDRLVTVEVQDMLQNGRLEKRGSLLYPAHGPGSYGSVRPSAPKTATEQKQYDCKIVKLGRTFGFAQRLDGEGDIFLPGRAMMGAMPGDEVKVALFDKPRVPGSMEGKVTAITKPRKEFIGRLARNEYTGEACFIPDECPDLMVPLIKADRYTAKLGDKVAATLFYRGSAHADHRARITCEFGDARRAMDSIRANLYIQGVEPDFRAPVLREAAPYKDARPDPAEMAKRLDLRGLPIFTIDGAATKDIDDAVSIQQTAEGYRLGVHIADVSHYVTPGSELDNTAFDRATSIYYGNTVIPMLPKELSNGICSLNPGEDRLAFSCLMWLDINGNLKQYRFEKTVIHSRVKGVYSEINAILAGQGEEHKQKYAVVMAQLPLLLAFYKKRLALRKQRGGMDIESGESEFTINEQGICVDVAPHETGVTQSIIEECMLLANQCSAHLARTHALPFVYRVHEKPDADHLDRLFATLKACGVHAEFKGEEPTPRELSVILDKYKGDPLEQAVHTGILRSMEKAKYAPTPKGHFGLALQDYAHFTSPIRRYPDLAIHRILSAHAAGMPDAQINKMYADFVQKASTQSSAREVRALQVERAAEACYKAEYMLGHLGEEYVGHVSGVTPHGLYVQLDNTVEGMIPVASLCTGEPLVTEGVRMEDALTGQSWSMGDSIRVKAARADVADGKVDFEPIWN